VAQKKLVGVLGVALLGSGAFRKLQKSAHEFGPTICLQLLNPKPKVLRPRPEAFPARAWVTHRSAHLPLTYTRWRAPQRVFPAPPWRRRVATPARARGRPPAPTRHHPRRRRHRRQSHSGKPWSLCPVPCAL